MTRAKFHEGRLRMADGTLVPWLAAGICYADHAPRQWPSQLAQIRAAGFTMVDVVVPWRSHLNDAGEADFFGALALPAFLDHVHQAGLVAVLRLGPVASLTRPQFGLPDSVLANAAMQARSSAGLPIWAPTPTRVVSVPSYDSSEFLDAVGAWFALVAQQAAAHVAVGAVIVDLGDHWFLRTGAFDGDYQSDAVAAWHQDQSVAPPVDGSHGELTTQLAWVRFKAHRAIRAGRALRERLTAAGWNHHACIATVSTTTGMQVRTALAHLYDGLVVQHDRVDPSALPYGATAGVVVAALAVSRAAWLPPRSSDLAKLVISAIADGASGLSLTGWVPGDHEVAATTPARIASILPALQHGGWPTMINAAPVAVVRATHHDELAAIHCALALASPALIRFAGLDPIALTAGNTDDAVTAQRWHTVLQQALTMAGVAFDVVDDTASADQLAGYRVVIAPTGGHVAAAFAATLRDVASRKNTTIVLGPTPAQRDETNRGLAADAMPMRVGRLRAASLHDAAGLAADLQALGGDANVALRVEPATTAVYLGREPSRFAVVINDSPQLVRIIAADAGWHDALLPTERAVDEFFVEAGRWLLLTR